MFPIELRAYVALYAYRHCAYVSHSITLYVYHVVCASLTGGRLNSLMVNASLGGETEAG